MAPKAPPRACTAARAIRILRSGSNPAGATLAPRRPRSADQTMATRADIEFTYTSIDRIFRMSLGELADFSGALYDGDFSLTLEQAQARKHEYIAEQIGIGPGRRLLDLGCGWGALLNFARGRGAEGVGVALSSAQVDSCRRHGLDVHLRDARTVDRETFGPFDAVASLGAFEHFCSPDEYRAGRQEEIYEGLFANTASVLEPGGRFYLQTMVFGRNMIAPGGGLRARSARLRRVHPVPARLPVPGLVPALRPGADRALRAAALPPRRELERAP